MNNEKLDGVLKLLQSERRRYVLELLSDSRSADAESIVVNVNDLAWHIAAVEGGEDPTENTRTQQRSVTLDLQHTHLPMLEENGVIEYDSCTKEVSTTERTWSIVKLMRDVEDAFAATDKPLIEQNEVDT